MSQSHFRKSWGAEPVGDGRWHFRLWAPGAQHAAVRLQDRVCAMDLGDGGWFEFEAAAPDGAAYSFIVDDQHDVPDPAARAQMGDVHGSSRLVDPRAFTWETGWTGRPWHETVLYELHVGTFTPTGDFDGVLRGLDHLARTGVSAIELCPVAQFSGERGWGYDGVLLYAPHRAYGGPEGLKRLVDAAHARGLMVFLDVVYNHFGPEGNYLPSYAPEFFDRSQATPWGDAIAFGRTPVRRFFIENALYWLDEYRIDGLRLDAVDQIRDTSSPSILEELAQHVRAKDFGRTVHLTTEDDRNITSLHRRDADGQALLYDGEWNDDFHHVAHVLATGENDGYYADYADQPRDDIATALRDGFVEQGRASPFRGGIVRGEPSTHLPAPAFVNFLQNHDQTGNRAFGERLTTLAEPAAVEALTLVLLLSPTTPLLFMGEEWGEARPFQFFCDFHGELAEAVRQGRRQEFAAWREFSDPATRERIPDPNDPATFERSKLDWDGLTSTGGAERHALVQRLLALRAQYIVPRLAGMSAMNGEVEPRADRGLHASWQLGDGSRLALAANLGGEPFALELAGTPLAGIGRCDRDRWAAAATLTEEA